MKRISSLLLALLLIFALLPGQSLAARNSVKAIQLVQRGETAAAANLPGGQQSSIWFGGCQQSARGRDASTDPVKWRVLENEDGQLLLLADQNLDARSYHSSAEAVAWKDCSLRAWLNDSENGFLGTVFTKVEAAALAETAVEPARGKPRGAETDRLFLLSGEEAEKEAYGFQDEAGRVSRDTAYAAAQGGDGSWWLRGPNSGEASVACVKADGSFDSREVIGVAGVRPAAKLSLNAVLFSSAAEDARGVGSRGVGALQKVPDYTGSEWKLTLLDDSRSFQVAETELSGAGGQTVELHYTGAVPCEPSGDQNEYVSAMIVDRNGSVLFYGKLVQPTAADGTLSLKLPSTGELPAGSYSLLVFSEQDGGDKKTDLASAFCRVNLTVTTQTFKIHFLDEDGTLLATVETAYGETPVYPNSDPTKDSTVQHDYSFAGWSPALAPATADMTYRATYSESLRQYTIKFVNENGAILQNDKLPYGVTPVFNGETPTIDPTAQYTFTFSGWTPAIVPVTKDEIYTAVYSRTVNDYTIRFLNDDRTVLQESNTVPYGETPVYHGDAPTKAPTDQYVFTFAGWTPKIIPVIGNADYMAVYTASPREYPIHFLNYDGEELPDSPILFRYGEMPEYTGEKPAKDSTEEYIYSFAGWTPEIVPVDHEATYTAVFSAKEIVNYTITEGADSKWTKGTAGSHRLVVKRSPKDDTCFSHYKETWIDDKPIAVTIQSGSTIITISSDTLNSLGIGPHIITVKFDDGEVETKLSVKAPSSDGSGGSGGSPRTGGVKALDILIGLSILAGLALGVTAVIVLKRRRDAKLIITVE